MLCSDSVGWCSQLSDMMMGAGGQLVPAAAEEDEQVGKKVKQKMSRKERLQRKRDQKRAERQAGSDDEDVNQGEFGLGMRSCGCNSAVCHCSIVCSPALNCMETVDCSLALL